VQLAAPDDALSIRRPHVIRWKQHLVDLGDSPRQSGTASGDREGRRVWVVDKEPRVTPWKPRSLRFGWQQEKNRCGLRERRSATSLQTAARASDPLRHWSLPCVPGPGRACL